MKNEEIIKKDDYSQCIYIEELENDICSKKCSKEASKKIGAMMSDYFNGGGNWSMSR